MSLLSSKEIIEKTGISRATLNNYVAQGILPRPVVRNPHDEVARRLGFFPVTALDTIERVKALKRGGMTMAEIATLVSADHRPATPREDTRVQPIAERRETAPPHAAPIAGPALCLDHIDSPAYFVNNRFEVEWCNAGAEALVLGADAMRSGDIVDRNLFRLMLGSGRLGVSADAEALLRFHLAIAKKRMSRQTLLEGAGRFEDATAATLFSLFDSVEPVAHGPLLHTEVRIEGETWYTLYANFYREGIFFSYAPMAEGETPLLAFLSRRELVIRDLLKKRRPYLTPLAVLVADIQDSVRICAELPPEEYFALINGVWSATEPLMRKYYATHGKHAGDGLVCYFFPQPDCDYAYNAVQCARDIRAIMAEVSREWCARKNWLNELRLNIGIHEGEEWFGTYQTPTHLEFTVLGDTVNAAARLSDFARNGSIWATKSLIGRLPAADRETVRYGIRRTSETGEDVLVPATFARVSNLADMADPRAHKLLDISALPVTEILDVLPPRAA